jgi:hypothetical protein
VASVGLGKKGEERSPQMGEERKLGCRVYWFNIFANKFQHEQSIRISNANLDALDYKLLL